MKGTTEEDAIPSLYQQKAPSLDRSHFRAGWETQPVTGFCLSSPGKELRLLGLAYKRKSFSNGKFKEKKASGSGVNNGFAM